MNKLVIILCLILFTFSSKVQSQYKLTYNQAKEFEGVYEYSNQEEIKMAASPQDSILYVIIQQSKYRLTPTGDLSFLNSSGEDVRFYRDSSAAIAGYIYQGVTYQKLNRTVSFPLTMWYPRIYSGSKYTYQYQQPVDRKDGLEVGNLSRTSLDTGLISQMIRKIGEGNYPDVHSILIIKDGKLVLEEYFYEYQVDSLHELRSATKSFVSALTGIAIDKGFIPNKQIKVLSYFPEYSFDNMSEAKKQITIENLLTNQSGLDCDINNELSVGNETKMNNSNDWVKFTLDLPMIDSPGGKGMYCSGNVILLGRIIEKATNMPLPEFAAKYMFNPLGIQSFQWHFKPDVSSAETFCQLYLKPRDMAKFGLLYLHQGKWKGESLISSDWIIESMTKHSSIQNVDYGYLWWIKYLNVGGEKIYGKIAQGNGGQRIYLWKQYNMVVVITSGLYNRSSFSDELVRTYILPAFLPN